MSLWAGMSFWATPAKQAQRASTLHWLSHLGLPGVFGVAIIDSSPIPLPIPGTTDLLLLWLVAHKGNPFYLVASAVAGGLVGGYLSWQVGRKGGEEMLKRRVPARLLNPVHRWVESNPILSVFIPAMMPPPVPLSPFVLAAGALGVPVGRFMAAFGAARAIRYSLVAWLGVTYGRHVVRLWTTTLDKWQTPLMWTFGTLFAGGIVFAIVKMRQAKTNPKARQVGESAAD